MNQPIQERKSQTQDISAKDITVGGDFIIAPKQIDTYIETQILEISAEKVTQQPLIKASPYKGLKRFNFGDREYFFGRDALIAKLFKAVNKSSFSLILGASGSGKSSVVRAGLIPELKKSLKSQKFYDFIFTPNQDPFQSLYRCLLSEEKDYQFSESEAKVALEARPKTLPQIISTLKKDEERWLLFIDQFEQLFTICTDLEKRKNFIEGIVQVAKKGDSSVRIVLAMRSDFLEQFSFYPTLAAIADQNNIHLVTEMYPDELRQAIEQPAAKHGVVFEKGLVEQIIEEVEGQSGYLPLLQYTLDLLWQKECTTKTSDGRLHIEDRTLNKTSYADLEGVRGALQKRVNEIYKDICKKNKDGELVIKQIFLKLVNIVESDSGSRPVSRRAYRYEFVSEPIESTLKRFIDENLLVSSYEYSSEEELLIGESTKRIEHATIEIAHEILLSSWDKLKRWLEEEKEAIILKNWLAGETRRWLEVLAKDKSKANDELLKGSRLDQIVEFRKKNAFEKLGGLVKEENQFIDASVDWRDRLFKKEEERRQRELEQERKARRAAQTRTVTAIVSALLLGIGAIFANSQRLEIKKQSANSDYQQGTRLLENDETAPQGMAMLARSVRQGQYREASIRLWTLLQQRTFWIPVRTDSNSTGQAPISSADIPVPIKKRFSSISVQGQTYAPDFIEVSADGSTVVTILNFHPVLDNQLPGQVMVRSNEEILKMFDWDSQQRIVDGTPITSWPLLDNQTPQVMVWSVDGTPITSWFTPSYSGYNYVESLPSAHLSSDGRFVAVVAHPWREPDFIEIWNVEEGRPIDIVTATGKAPQYQYVKFSKVQFLINKRFQTNQENDPLLLTASQKGDAAVYSVSEYRLKELARSQHRTEVVFASVDDDQEWLMSASADGEIRVASLHSGRQIGNPILLERAAKNLKRVGESRLQVTLERGEEQTFDLISPLEVSRPNNATVSEQEDNCVSWDEESASKKDSSIAIEHPTSGKKLAWMGKRRIKVFFAEDDQKELASPEFSADLKVVCFSDSGEHIMTTDFEFVTEIWKSDFQTRLGPPINERRLFSPGQTADQAKSILLSRAEDMVLTRTFFWDPPNVAYYWITVWDVKTGLPLTDRTLYADDGFSEQVVDSAVFGKSDEYLLLIDTEDEGSKVLHVIQLHPPHKALSWLPDLIEALGGIELDERGNPVSVENRIEQLEQLLPLLFQR